jgi:hypothetical protein
VSRRKRYDDEFRAGALIMLEGAGYPTTTGSLQRVADHLGLPTRTLRRWYTGQQNPPPDKVVAHIKRDFLEQLLAIRGIVAEKIVDRIDEFEPRDLTGLLKISAELAQLLKGQPTNRVEWIDRLSKQLDELPDDEYSSVIAEAERIVSASGAGGIVSSEPYEEGFDS